MYLEELQVDAGGNSLRKKCGIRLPLGDSHGSACSGDPLKSSCSFLVCIPESRRVLLFERADINSREFPSSNFYHL